MAGEWLKFEANTPEKPEVFSITVAMGWDDPDLTVGKLLKIWRWFDQHTVDGNAGSVTLALLDRVCGVTGFAQAMCDVGWIVCEDGVITLPNFDRHNGQTAKRRSLTAKRVANHKSNAEGNAPSVSAPLPREEKRREEKEEQKHERQAAREPSRFDEFWAVYPNKKGKADAKKAWRRKNLDALADLIIGDVKARAAGDRQWLEGFIPHGSTYVNAEGWQDAIEPPRRQAASGYVPLPGEF